MSTVVCLKAYKILPSFTFCVFFLTDLFFIRCGKHFIAFIASICFSYIAQWESIQFYAQEKNSLVFWVVTIETVLIILLSIVFIEQWLNIPSILEVFKIPVAQNQK